MTSQNTAPGGHPETHPNTTDTAAGAPGAPGAGDATQVERVAVHAGSAQPEGWWRDAVIYQIYPRSFADADGDGIGDLPGITSRLEHIAGLGVDAVWLSPFYRSPQHDAGYDVADYRDVDPLFGTLADADALLARAHELGLRVIVDLVPNHTSEEHAWFQAALAAGPGSPERARFWFRDGRTDPATGEVDTEREPTNWRSVFGGTAWSRVCDRKDAPGSTWADDRQWYLHLFDSSQPDLDWDNPEVRAEFRDVLRFWLDRGVDGFRVDVAHGLAKDRSLPDWDHEVDMVSGDEGSPGASADEGDEGDGGDGADGGEERAPMYDQDGVHEIYREWRTVLEEYDHDPVLVAEAWVEPAERLVRYVRPDEMHQAFNFHFLTATWDTPALREAIEHSLRAHDSVDATTTWVLSNHDVIRHASRLGLAKTGKGPNGLRASDPQPDEAMGLRRARAATLLMLALPGSAYLYQGEELGLPEHTTLDDDLRQDPAYFRTGGAEPGRDGCRVPIPWESEAPGAGFSPTGETWLPQPPEYAALAPDVQDAQPGSTLRLYREALRLREELGLGHGAWSWVAENVVEESFLVGVNHAAEDEDSAGGSASAGARVPVYVVTNTAEGATVLPAGFRALLASGPLPEVNGVVTVPQDTTVWAVDALAHDRELAELQEGSLL